MNLMRRTSDKLGNTLYWRALGNDMRRDWQKYLMLLIPIGLLFVFSYMPMYGILIAFKNFSLRKGIMGSPWVGLANFERVFAMPKFLRVVRNTFFLNILHLLVNFPAPILLAILLNEMRRSSLKRYVQTVSYLPHFLSTVILYGITYQLCAPTTGLLNQLYLGALRMIGASEMALSSGGIPFLTNEQWWLWTYTISGTWQGVGWGSIIYIAAIAGINQELYEAADVDGSNRWQKMWHITLPGIRATVVLMLILEIGGIASISFEKPYLFGNAIVNNVSEVISVYVYNVGLGQADFDTGTVVGLAQSVVAIILVLGSNKVAHLLGESGLWEGRVK